MFFSGAKDMDCPMHKGIQRRAWPPTLSAHIKFFTNQFVLATAEHSVVIPLCSSWLKWCITVLSPSGRRSEFMIPESVLNLNIEFDAFCSAFLRRTIIHVHQFTNYRATLARPLRSHAHVDMSFRRQRGVQLLQV